MQYPWFGSGVANIACWNIPVSSVMRTNWRSDPALVAGLNRLYAERPDVSGGDAQRRIRYRAVDAAAAENRIHDPDWRDPGSALVGIWSAPGDRALAEHDCARHSAEEIARLLTRRVTIADRATGAQRRLAADDIAVARAAGHAARLVGGAEENFKITRPEDLDRARRMAAPPVSDVRTGNGFDVHGFVAGDAVTLCGVRIPFERALAGHSDADVGMHAVTEAIFGALGDGDIGTWFPPSEPRWKGAPSHIFLARAAAEARARRFAITHLDCTLICEAPKIGPHAGEMRAALARIAGIEPDRVGVKATTSEGLGFTGRREGIAALATATLVRA